MNNQIKVITSDIIIKENNSFNNKLIKNGLRSYILIGNYNSKSVKLYHKDCGSYITTHPDKFFERKEKCAVCLQNRLNKEFQDFLDSKFNGEFKLVSNYKNNETKVSLEHTTHGFIIKKTPKSLKKIKNIGSFREYTNNNSNINFNCNTNFSNRLIRNGLPNYKLIGNYNSDSITLYHEDCGSYISTHPDKFFKRKEKCAVCLQNRLNKEFQDFLDSKFNGEFKLVSNYKNNETKVSLEHIICGSIVHNTPKVLKYIKGNNNICECIKEQHNLNKKLFYQDKINKLTNNEFELLSDYHNLNTYIQLKHLKCGYIFETRPDTFEASIEKCPKCANRDSKDISASERVHFIEKNLDNKFQILTKYFTIRDKVKLKHKSCGRIIERSASSLPYSKSKIKNRVKCDVCDLEERTDDFLDKLSRVQQNRFTLRGKYKKMTTPTLFRHTECNGVFKATPHYMVKKELYDCPKCRKK